MLLTGGSGFIGRNILSSPGLSRHAWASPGRAELDLCDTDAVDAYFRDGRFDCVVHAAAQPGHRAAADFDGLLYRNSRMFFNLARQLRHGERMILMGSGAAYDLTRLEPRTPEEAWGLHIPEDIHGYTQYLQGRAAAGMPGVTELRLFGVFGPWEDFRIRFPSSMVCMALAGKPLSVRQDRRFDFLWIDDLMPVLDRLIEGPPRHGAYNVTPDETVHLLDVAGRVRDRVDPGLEIRVLQPGRGREYSGANDRLKAEFPEFSPTPLDTALDRLIAWYRAHPERVEQRRGLDAL